jgi:predicted Zn-dependent peptidase
MPKPRTVSFTVAGVVVGEPDMAQTLRPGSGHRVSGARTGSVASDSLRGTVRRTVLPNGMRILTEAIPTMRSVSFGIWVGVGSRDETPELAGVSHFLEHLLYKGTERRSALEISAALEAVGGETNAFTTREYTCYYARVLDEDLPLAVDVVCDLLAGSVLDEADVETERGVILEEIAMHDDEPADAVHDRFYQALLGQHPLGRPISGTVESISALTHRQVLDFYRSRYVAPHMVVTAAGNLEHSAVVAAVDEAFAGVKRFAVAGEPAGLRTVGQPVITRQEVDVQNRDTEQANLLIGCPAPARLDERRFALGVLNNAIGGGMSSRLFQEIRERRGLAYSVYSYTSQYADAGVFAVYAGCAPTKAEEVLSLARAELDVVAHAGLSDEEISRGKGMLKGSLVLGLEDTGSRMSQLGKGELLYGEPLGVDELLRRINAVTPEQVGSVAATVLSQPMSLAVVGPFPQDGFRSAI